MKSYKKMKTKEERATESTRILAKHPDFIPVVIESNDKRISSMKKRKFLAPSYVSASYLSVTVHKHLPPEVQSASTAIFMFYMVREKRNNIFGKEVEVENSVLISGSQMISDIYRDYIERNKLAGPDDDKFLYITIQCENTFGNL